MSKASLDNLRHSCAHLLAAAVVELWPGAKRAIGPAIENGFYYDFDFGDAKISEDDFPVIEAKMRELVNGWKEFERKEVSADEARAAFANNPYKLELIDEFAREGQMLTLYVSGAYADLCRGGHTERPAKALAHFKLLSVAGAYWRGSEKNKMLTRIYGTCFPADEELERHLAMLEEAKKRDHKKLGRELDLFVIDDKVGKGLPMWTPKGTAVKFALENFTRELERKYGYEHVSTPYLGAEELYRISGHLDHYAQNMYAPIDMDGDIFYLRPMACPHHIRLYQRRAWSYKELPVRYAEIADYNRYEKSGELMGMFRVRKFQLTDGHLFVTQEGLKQEFQLVCRMITEGMKGLGLESIVSYRFSKRDPNNKEKYYPDDELWNRAEACMKEALDELQFSYTEALDEAAFYGPKLDVQARNVNGKEDTLFTAQMDFLLPKKFDIEYTNADGQKKRPVMIHRSTIGSLERLFGFLIERYAGAFPVWLAPVQARFAPVAERHNDGARTLAKEFADSGVRVHVDESSETVGNKVRKAAEEKIPYLIVVGDKELSGENLKVRVRGREKEESISRAGFLARIQEEIRERRLN